MAWRGSKEDQDRFKEKPVTQPPLAHPVPPGPSQRYVLLVLDDRVGSVVSLIRRAIAERGLVAEVVICGSADEAVARLRAGRRYSAVLAHTSDLGIEGVSAAARRLATPFIVVGADPGPCSPASLCLAVRTQTVAVRRADYAGAVDLAPTTPYSGLRRGHLVAVCGAGGAGTSVIAAALAVGLAGGPADQATGRRLLLADFALHSDQAMLHGLPDTTAGLLDLTALFRYRCPGVHQVRAIPVDVGRYRLLAGLRRSAQWTAVSPPTFDAALRGLVAAFEMVVAEVTGEFEGENEVGSIDTEERNHMARHAVREADVVVVVGGPGTAATRRLGLLIEALCDLGVDPERIQPVVNRITAPPWERAQWSPPPGGRRLTTAVGIPELGGVDTVPLPPDLAGNLCPAVRARLRQAPARSCHPALTPVLSGSIGCWPGSRPE